MWIVSIPKIIFLGINGIFLETIIRIFSQKKEQRKHDKITKEKSLISSKIVILTLFEALTIVILCFIRWSPFQGIYLTTSLYTHQGLTPKILEILQNSYILSLSIFSTVPYFLHD